MANDEGMIKAYEEKKDLYAVIGSLAFKNNYEDNLEFNPITHVLQPEGKARRSKAKTLLLGLNYGMSTKSLANRINMSLAEAEEMKANFYSGFKGVDRFTKASQEMLKQCGYVTDIYGRRRRIPDGTLPDYTITPAKKSSGFNPLIGAVHHEDEVIQKRIKYYEDKLSKLSYKKDIDKVIAEAKREGLSIRNNKGFVSKALRQCLNARIQGSSASVTKRAMILIHNDEEINKLGARLLVTVHDELLLEVKTENAEKAAQRVTTLMIQAAQEKCGNVAWKCDPYVVSDGWYEDETCGNISEDYTKLVKKGIESDRAIETICDKFPMFNADSIKLVCSGNYKIGRDSLKYGPNYFSK